MNETRQLAEFVVETGYSNLPPSVVEATRVYILDNLASGFVGAHTPWAEMARESAPQGPCSVFGRPWTTSPSGAALVNGTMIGSFETDHAFVQGSCHPSAAVFPAALAIAQRDHRSGRTLLEAVALGYEAVCRVGLAATRAVEDVAGFHGPATNAPFGGAAGAGKALGLDLPRLVNALGIAGSHAGGLMEFVGEGAMTKRIHVGRGAQMGLESAVLADKGFTGPSTVLEGNCGFLRVYSPSPEPGLLVEGLGERYHLLDMMVKAYACHASFHPVIDGIHRFRSEVSYDPAQIREVKVVGTESVVHRHGDREPSSLLGAQYSLPFSTAVALCRDIADPTVYNEETLWDGRIRELSAGMDLDVDPERFGKARGPAAEVSLSLDGHHHSFTVSGWKGAPGNPYTYDEMTEKFRSYAGIKLSPDWVERIVTMVRHLEDLDDVVELAGLLLSEYAASGPHSV